ncbi:hypothetical protein N9O44_00830 [Gammaproteobacteria bacterium]|nr:hypothetical protein [Gammaproteobacteria bacterium]
MVEKNYEELAKLIQKWITEKDLKNSLSKPLSNNSKVLARKLVLIEPRILDYSSLHELRLINPEVGRIIYLTYYKIYFNRRENVGKIGENVKIDGVEGTTNISVEDCYLSKKEMKEKFGETVANYLRQSEHHPRGCVRLADTNINVFYSELRKDALEPMETKSKVKERQTKVHRLLLTGKEMERLIKPLRNAIHNKSEYNDEEIASIKIIKENLEKTRDLCKSLYDKLKK